MLRYFQVLEGLDEQGFQLVYSQKNKFAGQLDLGGLTILCCHKVTFQRSTPVVEKS